MFKRAKISQRMNDPEFYKTTSVLSQFPATEMGIDACVLWFLARALDILKAFSIVLTGGCLNEFDFFYRGCFC